MLMSTPLQWRLALVMVQAYSCHQEQCNPLKQPQTRYNG
ncbi:vitamin B12-dependent ribonucleotide reductase [Acetobacter orientalis]|uniref:Vitamin B12-dependent ribonucleotide reductase n=1 Tax=Acetobacter orientalis TaxID=146474 RepID=A0A2Z5ZHR4_9PROT|nr:vitamin B12-dependent ribonucleotide reductase [Acetobacter orientalis]